MSNINNQRKAALERIGAAYENDAILRGRIVAKVKGGFEVDIDGVKAFLPGSKAGIRPIRDLDKFVTEDTEYDFEVIKFDERRRNIVLSRRVPLEIVGGK